MDATEQPAPTMRSARHRSCIVVMCADREAEQIGRQLSELDSGCLITYRRLEDMALNSPTGKVALVVLAGVDAPAVTRRTLKWLRHRWPGCPLAVVGDVGGGEDERAAREGGAMYVTRPAAPSQVWQMVAHVLGGRTRSGTGRQRGATRSADSGTA